QSLYLYCQEDAFDMMDAFRSTAGPDANLQTLARGVNVVGLDSQSSDIIDLHAKLFKKHGTTTIRNFDALNDVRNLSYSGRCIAEAGLKHEVTITLMELPPGCEGAHTPDFYMKVLEGILDDGVPFDSICFKDASGTAVPSKVYDTIKLARQRLGDDVHIRLHTHETAGVSVSAYIAALEAGVDGIDLALAPVSGGTSQPDFIVMWHALRGTDFVLGGGELGSGDVAIDVDKVVEVEAVFKACMKDYFMPPEATTVEPLIPYSPMPGGALTANTQMMRDAGTLDLFPDVIHAMSDVVRKGGFGTSVTPVSQFYFQQAYNNVVLGPWKRIAEGYGKMVLGYFGKTPVPPAEDIVALAREQLGLEPTTRNPRDINDEDSGKGIEAAKKLLAEKNLEVTDEAIFIASALKDKGIAFLQGDRPDGVRKVDPAVEGASASGSAQAYTVEVNKRSYEVAFESGKATVNGKTYEYAISKSKAGGKAAAPVASGAGEVVCAELAGQVLRLVANEGDQVAEGDLLLVLEALKMEIEIKAHCAGSVAAMLVSHGQAVRTGDPLVEIAP
ncbi:MAG: biotin/lipoyl-containing protein, partial [Myxococcota bacterium]